MQNYIEEHRKESQLVNQQAAKIQRDAQQKKPMVLYGCNFSFICLIFSREFLQHFSHVAHIFSDNLVWEAERLDDREVASVIYTHCGRSPLHFKALPTPCAPLGLLFVLVALVLLLSFSWSSFGCQSLHGSFLVPKFCIVDSPNL